MSIISPMQSNSFGENRGGIGSVGGHHVAAENSPPHPPLAALLPNLVADALLHMRSKLHSADVTESELTAVKSYLLSVARTDSRFDELPIIREARQRFQHELIPTVAAASRDSSGGAMHCCCSDPFDVEGKSNLMPINVGRLAAIRTSLTSALSAAVIAASNEELEGAIVSPPVVSSSSVPPSRVFAFDLDNLPHLEPLHATIEILARASRADPMDRVLRRSALEKVDKVDCDDLIDSPLWEEFICALHRLLFSEIDSMGGLVDCDENEVLIKTLLMYNTLVASLQQSPHQFEDILLSFLVCFDHFLLRFGRVEDASNRVSAGTPWHNRRYVLEHVRSRGDLHAFFALFSAVLEAVPAAHLDPPSNRKISDLIVLFLLSVIGSPDHLHVSPYDSISISNICWAIDFDELLIPKLLRYLNLHWSRGSLHLHGGSSGLVDACFNECTRGPLNTSMDRDRWFYFADIIATIGYMSNIPKSDNNDASTSSFRGAIGDAESCEWLDTRTKLSEFCCGVWNGRGNQFRLSNAKSGADLDLRKINSIDGKFCNCLLEALSKLIVDQRVSENPRYLIVFKTIIDMQSDIYQSTIHSIVETLTAWLKSGTPHSWSHPVVHFSTYILLSWRPSSGADATELFIGTYSKILDTVVSSILLHSSRDVFDYFRSEIYLSALLLRCKCVWLLSNSEDRLTKLLSIICMDKDVEDQILYSLLNFTASLLKCSTASSFRVRPETAYILVRFLEGVVTIPFVLQMPGEICDSVIEILSSMQHLVDFNWLETLAIGAHSAAISLEKPCKNSFIVQIALLGFTTKSIIAQLMAGEHRDEGRRTEETTDTFSSIQDEKNQVSRRDAILQAFLLHTDFCILHCASECDYKSVDSEAESTMGHSASERAKKQSIDMLVPWMQTKCNNEDILRSISSREFLNCLSASTSGLNSTTRGFPSMRWSSIALEIFRFTKGPQPYFNFLDENSIVKQATQILGSFENGKYAELFNFLFCSPSIFFKWLISEFFFPVFSLEDILLLVQEEVNAFQRKLPSEIICHPSSIVAVALLVSIVKVAAVDSHSFVPSPPKWNIGIIFPAAAAFGRYKEIADEVRTFLCI